MGNDSIITSINSILGIIGALITAMVFIVKWRLNKIKKNKEILFNVWRSEGENDIKLTFYENDLGLFQLGNLEKKMKLKIGLFSSTVLILDKNIPIAKIKIKIKSNQLEWKLIKNFSEYELPKKNIFSESLFIL